MNLTGGEPLNARDICPTLILGKQNYVTNCYEKLRTLFKDSVHLTGKKVAFKIPVTLILNTKIADSSWIWNGLVLDFRLHFLSARKSRNTSHGGAVIGEQWLYECIFDHQQIVSRSNGASQTDNYDHFRECSLQIDLEMKFCLQTKLVSTTKFVINFVTSS